MWGGSRLLSLQRLAGEAVHSSTSAWNATYLVARMLALWDYEGAPSPECTLKKRWPRSPDLRLLASHSAHTQGPRSHTSAKRSHTRHTLTLLTHGHTRATPRTLHARDHTRASHSLHSHAITHAPLSLHHGCSPKGDHSLALAGRGQQTCYLQPPLAPPLPWLCTAFLLSRYPRGRRSPGYATGGPPEPTCRASPCTCPWAPASPAHPVPCGRSMRGTAPAGALTRVRSLPPGQVGPLPWVQPQLPEQLWSWRVPLVLCGQSGRGTSPRT